MATAGMVLGSLAIGATIAGYQSHVSGKGFWRGFERYINGNWAQAAAISSITLIVTIGISTIASAVQNTRAVNYLHDAGMTKLDAEKMLKESFKGRIDVRTLKTDTAVNRVWGGKSRLYGNWVSPNNYGDKARGLLSLPNSNTATNVSKFILPKGTVIISGRAAQLFGQTGGGIQWWTATLC